MKERHDRAAKALETITARMRQEWNQRAALNAMYFIATGKDRWQEGDFLRSGEEDVARLVDPALQSMNLDPAAVDMVEIGCGVGRMTLALSRRFRHVCGVDISQEMISRARELQARAGATNVRYEIGNGKDLTVLADEAFGFCFSYIVFQHIPDFQLVRTYISEMGRVLKAGGCFLFQVNGYPHLVLPGSVYVFWGTRETGRLRKWGIRRRPILHFGKLDTWRGVPVRRDDVLAACQAASLEVQKLTGEGTQYMWFQGRKKP